MATQRTLLKWLAGIVGLPALYLLAVALVPGIKAKAQPLPGRVPQGEEPEPEPAERCREVSYDVRGTPVRGRLYLPDDLSTKVPCIVIGHGLGGSMAMLEPHAARFRREGFAVLAFDYRYWGESGGNPRQLVWIPYQLEDWQAAVEYARGLAEVDPARVALWGTSLSGGHVLATAATDQRVACVVAQVPALDLGAAALETLRAEGPKHLLHPFQTEHLTHAAVIVHAQRDLVRSWLRLSPHTIPLVGRPGTIAVMPDAAAWDTFARLAPEGTINEVCARIAIRMDKYRPLADAGKVSCPILLQVCKQDVTTPPGVVAMAERVLGNRAEVIRYPMDHFDVHSGHGFEEAVRDQLAFLRKHLRTVAPVSTGLDVSGRATAG